MVLDLSVKKAMRQQTVQEGPLGPWRKKGDAKKERVFFFAMFWREKNPAAMQGIGRNLSSWPLLQAGGQGCLAGIDGTSF